MADLGKGPGGPQASPLFWAKNEEIAEGRKVGRARKTPHPHPHLAQGLDLPLYIARTGEYPNPAQVQVKGLFKHQLHLNQFL